MKLYIFQGIKTGEQKKLSGTIQGRSKKACIEELLTQNIYVLRISVYRVASKRIHFDFFLYWSKLLHFSIPTHEILALLSEQFNNHNLKMISELLKEGVGLVEAFKRISDFDSVVIQLIEIGIKTNQLSHVLMTLYDYHQKNDMYKKELRMSLLYPGITCIFIIIAFTVSLSYIDQQYLNHSYLWVLCLLPCPFLIPKNIGLFLKNKKI